MTTCPTLETKRLILRPFNDDDVDRYFAIHDNPEVRAALHIAPEFDRDMAWGALARWLGQWALRNSGNWALELKSTGELIGRAGTHRPELVDWPGLEIGWTVDPSHWGRGYATEAGRKAIEWAFANHDDNELFSCILPTNSASQAVARRLGYTLREEKVLSFFPAHPLGIWVLPRTPSA